MGEETRSANETVLEAQFTVDLSEIELTEEEVSALQNRITRLAVEFVQQRSGGPDDAAKKKEPYVKITFVKAVPPKK